METSAKSKSSVMPYSPEDLEGNEITIPHVSIVEDGQAISNPNIMRPEIMQFVMTMKMVRDIAKMRQIAEDGVASGETDSWNPTVTDKRIGYRLVHEAISVAIENLGPNEVRVWFNGLNRSGHLVPGYRIFNLDFKGHKLKNVHAQCAPGETATLRCNFKE